MKKLVRYKWYFLAFFISFLPRYIICFINPTQMRLIPDEIGMLAGTAYAAGLDWGPVVSTTSYYGSSYHILFAPILALTDDFVLFHFILRIAASILSSLVAIIAFRIMDRFMSIDNPLFMTITAVICSYCSSWGIRNISNEYMLIFISWLIAYMLFRLNEDVNSHSKKIRLHTTFLTLLLGYALTLHNRSLILWITTILMVIMYAIIYKRKLVSFPIFFANIILFYILIHYMEQIILINVWGISSDAVLDNTSSNLANIVSDGLTNLFTYYNVNAAFKILFGNIYSLFYFTGTITVAAVIFAIRSIYQHIRAKNQYEIVRYQSMDLVFWFFVFCIMIMICGLAATWYPGISKALQGIDIDKYAYFYKGIVYTRYYANYTGPVLMICLVFIKEEALKMIRYFWKMLFAVIFLIIYWLKYVVVYLMDYAPTVREFAALTFHHYDSKKVTYAMFLPAVLFILIMLFVLIFCIYKNKIILYALLVMVFMMYSKYYYDLDITTDKYSMAEAGSHYVKEHELDRTLPIYVPSKSASYAYQALLNRYTIIPDYPDETIDSAIVFTSSIESSTFLEEWGYEMINLDKKVFVWIKGIEWKVVED